MAKVIEILVTSPLTVALVFFGVICIIVAIIGKIPPIDVTGSRAVSLGIFGVILILLALIFSYMIANIPDSAIPQQPTITEAITPHLESPSISLTSTDVPIPTFSDSDFPFRVDGEVVYAGSIHVMAGRHVIEIGNVAAFYSNPSLNFDADNLVEGFARTFFRTGVTGGEVIILCLSEAGKLSMGETANENLGEDLRNLSCD